MKVNVLPNGRRVLPVSLRRSLGVEKGGQLVTELDGDVITLTTSDQALDEAGALFRSLLTDDTDVADKIIGDHRRSSAIIGDHRRSSRRERGGMMPSCVSDTSAVFIDLQNERGADEARKWLRDAVISSVNLHEIVAKVIEKDASPDQAKVLVEKLRLTVHPHGEEDPIESGLLRSATKSKGLSLGDRACLVFAKKFGLPAVTGGGAWVDVANDLGVKVVMVR